MSPFGHGCHPLCDACLAEQLAQFAGVAQRRGEAWAESVARVCPIDKPWPRTPKSRAIALRKVEDITGDEKLRDRLAELVEVGAARWWDAALAKAG